MKKILSLALSISLMLSSVSSVWAAGSEDGTQTVPSSYDIRSEGGTPHTESSLSASGLTEEAQGSDFAVAMKAMPLICIQRKVVQNTF